MPLDRADLLSQRVEARGQDPRVQCLGEAKQPRAVEVMEGSVVGARPVVNRHATILAPMGWTHERRRRQHRGS